MSQVTDRFARFPGQLVQVTRETESPAGMGLEYRLVNRAGGTHHEETLRFQDGPVAPDAINGMDERAVMLALLDRLRSVNAVTPLREVSVAITKIEEAYFRLNDVVDKFNTAQSGSVQD